MLIKHAEKLTPEQKRIKESEYSTFGKTEFRNVFTGEIQKTVDIDWSHCKHISYIDTDTSQDHIWTKYLSKLPDYVILDQLSEKEFGDNTELKDIYYKKPYMCPKAKLSSLPESTLKKLVKMFN